MAAINTGKVITAGLLAGLVMNVCDMVWNGFVLKDEMIAMATRFGMDPVAAESFSAAVPWILVDFALGLVLVWNYAAIRPRFGPGPKTAMLAGFVPYLAVTLVLYGFMTMGMFTPALFVKSSLLALVSVILGSLAGGWAYKEA